MNKILFIGTGAWATALANSLATNPNNIVHMWGISKNEIDEINCRQNKKYFKNIKLSKNISASLEIDDFILDNNYIFLSVPSSVLKNVTSKVVNKINNNPIFINVVKGLDKDSNNIWSNSLRKIMKNSGSDLVTLSGPSFAIDVIKRKPTVVNVAGLNKSSCLKVKNLFNHNHLFEIIISSDEIGIQICGALKNLLAIATGIAKENHSSINTISAILTFGIKEISIIIDSFGGKKESILDLSGIGDIFLTCTSNKSRNFTFGRELYKKGFKLIKELNFNTVEGYSVYPIVDFIIKENKLNVPIMKTICEVLSGIITPKDFVKISISRILM
ncbi:MAG: NAD(P)H-dependent glycerol-3-phosphate dehydrogenase [Mycoplasmoidaceae bacterium]